MIDKKCFYKSLKKDYMSYEIVLLISSIIGGIIGYKYNHEILQLIIQHTHISASYITLMALVSGTCWLLYEIILESPLQHEFVKTHPISVISVDIFIFTVLDIIIFILVTFMYCIYLCATGFPSTGGDYLIESLAFTTIVYLITLVILPIARGIALCKNE